MRLNKRMKKKAFTYKVLSKKQRLKNQAKTIRQLYLEIGHLKYKLEVETDRANDLLLDRNQAEAELKTERVKPWWKKVLK